jgi:hypothetical protein
VNAIKRLYGFPLGIMLAVLMIPAITFAQQGKKGNDMETDTPLATAHKYLEAFNRGDVKAMAAAFAVPGQILDGMARGGLGMGERRSIGFWYK